MPWHALHNLTLVALVLGSAPPVRAQTPDPLAALDRGLRPNVAPPG